MIAEFAVIPDVFEKGTYSSPELGDLCLAQLLEVCREEVVVRDFCDGGWSENLSRRSERWHGAAKEVLETLGKEGRLRRFKQVLPQIPDEDVEWYYEAAASMRNLPLDLILAGAPAALGCEDDAAVVAITKLHKSAWWQRRSPSENVRRETADYLRLLRPLFRRAGSFMFIDPHLDEREPNFGEFHQLVRELCIPGTTPRIEIHIWQKVTTTISDWRSRLEKTEKVLNKARMQATLHVWPVNFHDRYLITDLMGLQLPYGFDISTKGVKETTWGRLGRRDRESVELRFEPNAGNYGEVRSFALGHSGD